jgi:uncharacterized membrane protein
MALRLLRYHSMREEAAASHPLTTLFPSVWLTITPLLDMVRILTGEPVWSRFAFWSAFLGVLVAAIAVVPELVDWLTADRGSRARNDGAAPLLLHFAALWPLALGVVERVHIASAARAAAAAGLPTITRLDAWPMALAIAGGLAWLVAALLRDDRPALRRYPPSDVAWRA